MAKPGQVRVSISVEIGADNFHDHARSFNFPADDEKIHQTILQIAESMKPFWGLPANSTESNR